MIPTDTNTTDWQAGARPYCSTGRAAAAADDDDDDDDVSHMPRAAVQRESAASRPIKTEYARAAYGHGVAFHPFQTMNELVLSSPLVTAQRHRHGREVTQEEVDLGDVKQRGFVPSLSGQDSRARNFLRCRTKTRKPLVVTPLSIIPDTGELPPQCFLSSSHLSASSLAPTSVLLTPQCFLSSSPYLIGHVSGEHQGGSTTALQVVFEVSSFT
ncbi:hypothetical protein ElyMa_006115300 [Elysia marginata]|uniref:Uncharacterized protein n=1 Tax=Elysia marginata TaxID=1093978 RepID=A0AAV4GVF6_9GAST|nr:hypothetical protein ElyMa_006115300 [Elysia marginata]